MADILHPRWPETPLTGFYPMPEPSEFISLYKGSMAYDFIGHTPTPGHGEIHLRWVPVPHLAFQFEEDGSSDTIGYNGGAIVIPNFAPFPGHFHELRSPSGGHGRFFGTIPAPVYSSPPTLASSVIFHLANLARFRNGVRHLYDYTPSIPLGRLLLLDHEWQIVIDQIAADDTLDHVLDTRGGFVLSHVGRIERVDQGPITILAYANVATLLHMFLSFAKGYWITPVLPLGFVGDSEVWRCWNHVETREWHNSDSWLPWNEDWVLLRLFPRFRQLLDNPLWSVPFQRAIQWYISANDSRATAETSIILAVVALELIGWVLVVEDHKLRPPARFDELNASQRLRALLRACAVPTKIPDELEHLGELARAMGGRDGPTVLTEARNALVHANPHRRPPAIANARYPVWTEAWRLAMWYLDLTMLRVVGHDTYYANRLAKGRTELVPWGTAPLRDERDV